MQFYNIVLALSFVAAVFAVPIAEPEPIPAAEPNPIAEPEPGCGMGSGRPNC